MPPNKGYTAQDARADEGRGTHPVVIDEDREGKVQPGRLCVRLTPVHPWIDRRGFRSLELGYDPLS